MKLTLDVENTTTKRDGKLHLDPFEPDNKLVMVGCLEDNGAMHLFNTDRDADSFDAIQKLLDRATILIGHNIVYDLMWLWESGLSTRVLSSVQCLLNIFYKEASSNLYI